jgi:carbon-monoxide dehydrogenase medium subunit
VLRPFEFCEPTSVAEASSLLARHGENARIYAGGTELLLAMKMGLLQYEHLVSIKGISGLVGIRFDAGANALRIGGATRHREVELSPVVRERFSTIAQMEAHVANVRVREQGTIAGNLCFAEPHADPGTLLQVYDATVTLEKAGGRRSVPLEKLFVGPFEVALEGDEILSEITVPALPPRMAAAYLKFGILERPSVGVGVAVGLNGGGVREVRIAVGCVGPVPRRMREAEAMLAGKSLAEAEALLPAAGQAAARAADAVSDLHGGADYKEHLVKVLIGRAFQAARQQLN